MTNIYGLIDPRINEVRYVGKADNIEQRLVQHLAPSNLRGNSHKENWMKSLLREGLKPIPVVLEVVDDQNWAVREKHWIKVCKLSGCNLTNSTEGGEGTQELEKLRKRMSDIKTGHPAYPTQQKAASESNKRRPLSPKVIEVFKKNWNAPRKPHSEETKRKIAQARLSTKLINGKFVRAV